jgi:hypothetical protein
MFNANNGIRKKIGVRLGKHITPEMRREYLLRLDRIADHANYGVHGEYIRGEKRELTWNDSENLIESAMIDDENMDGFSNEKR